MKNLQLSTDLKSAANWFQICRQLYSIKAKCCFTGFALISGLHQPTWVRGSQRSSSFILYQFVMSVFWTWATSGFVDWKKNFQICSTSDQSQCLHSRTKVMFSDHWGLNKTGAAALWCSIYWVQSGSRSSCSAGSVLWLGPKPDWKWIKNSSNQPAVQQVTLTPVIHCLCFCFIFSMFASCCSWMCPDSSDEGSGENEGHHNSYTNSAFSSPPSPQHEHSCKACGLCFGTHAKKVISPTC